MDFNVYFSLYIRAHYPLVVALDKAPPKVPFIQNLLFPVGIDGNIFNT